MKKYRFFGMLILITLFAFIIYSCGQQQEVTPTPEEEGVTTGYKLYSGTGPSGQKFSFEYPETWTTSQETLTSSWEAGTWIMFKGSGDWQTGVPILSLWIVPKSETLTDEASYNAEAYSDRNVSYEADNTGPGLISEASTIETVAGLTAEGWRIIYRTRLPLGRIYTSGEVEYDDLMAGSLVTAESEWIVFQKGSYLYDLNFEVVGDKITYRSAYLHAKQTFKFK